MVRTAKTVTEGKKSQGRGKDDEGRKLSEKSEKPDCRERRLRRYGSGKKEKERWGEGKKGAEGDVKYLNTQAADKSDPPGHRLSRSAKSVKWGGKRVRGRDQRTSPVKKRNPVIMAR